MAPETFVLIAAGLLGATVGSFLNVCIVRLPADQSLIRPRSRCPRCEQPIAWYDNIPVLSWILLRGKCRRCGQPISAQYPLIEAAVAALWLGAAWWHGLGLDALTAALFGTLLLGIAVTDARHYLIPDEYTLAGLPLGLALAWRNGASGFVAALTGAAVGFALLYAVAWLGEKIARQEAMGGGDIKMMAMVGAFVGAPGVVLTLFGGAFVGMFVFGPLLLTVFLGLLVRRGRPVEVKTFRRYFNRYYKVPFGVFLAVAAALTFEFGDAVVRWYVRVLV